VDRLVEELVALERSALDRWIKLDPQGYLHLLAPEVTYFDPFTERGVDGLEVQRHGDVALLTFNLVNYGKLPDAPERVLARWNSTEVYSRIGATWKIIHSHWSYIQPELKQPAS
jgi:ketosteroid isomerase-like protein